MGMTNIKNAIVKFLLYTQRFTELDNVYLARGGFWFTVINILNTALGLGTTVAFTRLAGKIVYGQYLLVLTIIDILDIFSLPGINTATTQATADGKPYNLGLLIKEKFKFSLLGSLVALIIGIYFIFFQSDYTMFWLMVIVGMFLPFHTAFNVVVSYYYGIKEFKVPSIYQMAMRLCLSVVLLITIFLGGTIFWIIGLYFFITGVFNMYFYFYWKKNYRGVGVLKQNTNAEIIAYGKKLSAINIIPSVLNNIDNVFVSRFLGVGGLAEYSIATKIGDTVKGYFNSMENVIFPKLVNLPGSQLLKHVRRFSIFLAFIGISIAFGFVAFFVIPWFFGEEFRVSILSAQIYVFALWPLFMRRVIMNWFLANKMSKAYLYITNVFMLGIAASVFLFLWMYPSVVSAVSAKLFAFLITLLVGLFLVKKYSV